MKMVILTAIILIFSSNILGSESTKTTENVRLELNLDKFFSHILQKDVLGALDYLNSLDDDKMSSKDHQIKAKLLELCDSRFISQTETLKFETENSSVIEIANLFTSYWIDILINEDTTEHKNSELENDMITLLSENNFLQSDIPREVARENIYQYTNEFLKSQGFYSNAMGTTSGIYDIYLWKTNTEKFYDVILPEEEVEVKVNFMEDFIIQGWSFYATFGSSSTGGWTTKDAIFCLKDSYDVKSEHFQSYIRHEGQHFTDRNAFPKLCQTDLEYRAKLAELSFSKDDIIKLLNEFLEYGIEEKNDNNPHAFADYCIIRDLSQVVFGREYVSELEEWEKIPAARINEASISLIKQHTKNLNRIGAKTVTEFIN